MHTQFFASVLGDFHFFHFNYFEFIFMIQKIGYAIKSGYNKYGK